MKRKIKKMQRMSSIVAEALRNGKTGKNAA